MSNLLFVRESIFELQFWLQILGDHGRFIHDALAPGERNKIGLAGYFAQVFDELLDQSRMQLNDQQLYELMKQSLSFAEEIRRFKLELIRDHLSEDIKIGLPPTFINHMVNEVEEFLRIIQCLLEGIMPAGHPLHYHKLWLPDAAGHAGAVICSLDDVENDLRMISKEFEMDFHDLHMKADEFNGYTRANLMDFPALKRLNHQVEMKIISFMRFLQDIEELRLTKKAVGTLQPLMADHMYREECYYLYHLSKVSDIDDPGCDPTSPRISG